MNRTVHKKLTEKHLVHNDYHSITSDEHLLSTYRQEKRILDSLAKDLMQPRPEAIASLLARAKDL